MKTADVLDEFISSTEEARVPDGKLHPSSMWMCDRQAVLVARGEPVVHPPTAKNLRVFRLGKIIHTLIQEALLSKFGDEFVDEFEVVEIAGVAGHGDGKLLIADSDEGVIVWEFKSTRSLAKARSKPSEHHVMQGATYCVAVHLGGQKVKELRVVYFEKTDLEIVEHVLPWDPKWVAKVQAKVADLQPYLLPSSTNLPACNGPDWLIKGKYCPFYGKHCRGSGGTYHW